MNTLKYIESYRNFILEFEASIKKEYGINDNIYNYLNVLFERKGNLGRYEYLFHGAGCRIMSKGIICEYDFLDYDGNTQYQFSVWKLKTFIESFYDKNIDQSALKESLDTLVVNNKLKKLVIEGRVFDIYLIE
ncbi:DUF6896 domain-containing protein [Chryseobacterium potabilaquae]|uniref:DUF6896 domain-containing protein n=1 Tax=Chryseobacterium potabilaquae TaxID=2675057 RepID=A0A6N4X3T1_9FLAO|nr:hypothetical protein [Chryseobacterium potabilaquae]CAA7193828.1 hypothetical protein CHRY9293_00239 [Chryseobacterium potabilaquae]